MFVADNVVNDVDVPDGEELNDDFDVIPEIAREIPSPVTPATTQKKKRAPSKKKLGVLERKAVAKQRVQQKKKTQNIASSSSSQ